MNHFSSRGNVLATILTVCLMITAIFLTPSCQKEDGNHKPTPTPEEIERGYTDLEDLRNKLSGEWVANINQEDPYDVVLIQYNFFGEDGSKFIMFSANDILEPGSGYDLDTVSIKWNLVEDYQGYSKAGVKGDAIEVLAPNDLTNYLVVKKITADSLVCLTAMGQNAAEIPFSRILEPVATKSLRLPPAGLGEEKTKAGGVPSYELMDWMSKIPDSTLLRDMSIPGSHDAATYNVSEATSFAARSQERTLGNQFNAGIRVFDLRIRAEKGSDEAHPNVRLYHNFIPCDMSLDEALKTIVGKVKEHPTECAIVILKPEGNDFADGTGDWAGTLSWLADYITGCDLDFDSNACDPLLTMSEAYHIYYNNNVIPHDMNVSCSHQFHEAITMGEMRGKIAIFFRTPEDEYAGGAASISTWDEKGKMSYYYYYKTHTCDFYVQDNYGTGDSDYKWWEKEEKLREFRNALNLSTRESGNPSRWFANAASCYKADIFEQTPDYATTAEDLYSQFAGLLRSDQSKYRGIFLQDYAGVNEAKRISTKAMIALAVPVLAIPDIPLLNLREKALWVELKLAKAIAGSKDVNGEVLTKAVVENNFKPMMYRLDVNIDPHSQDQGKVWIEDKDISHKYIPSGKSVKIWAQADEEYAFDKWVGSDGSSSRDNPLSVTVTGDITYTASFVRGVSNSDLLPGVFTLKSSKGTRRVRFTKGNLRYVGNFDGEHSYSNYQFCDKQYTRGVYYTGASSSHVCVHFFPVTYKVERNNPKSPYSMYPPEDIGSYSDDVFANHLMSYNGKKLTMVTSEEWYNLLENNRGPDRQFDYPVYVNDVDYAFVLYPDDWTGEKKRAYSGVEWAEAEKKGLVCLPPNGIRYISEVFDSWVRGFYLTEKPNEFLNFVYSSYGSSEHVSQALGSSGANGGCVRLVYDVD